MLSKGQGEMDSSFEAGVKSQAPLIAPEKLACDLADDDVFQTFRACFFFLLLMITVL